MKQTDYLSEHFREYFTDESRIKSDIQSQMELRYAIVGFCTVFLFVFRHHLPFLFPHFFLVSCASWFSNMAIHLLSLKKSMLKRAYAFIPYNDALIAPFIFQFTGGFLSPFVITHVASNIASCLVYTRNKNLALRTLIILLISYLGVAFLQKFHILPSYLGYAQTMMTNNSFFYFVIIVTASILTGSYFLVRILNYHVHQMLSETTHSFENVLRGTISAIGQDLFVRLTQYLSQSLSARCAMIAELTKKGASIRSLAVWKDGHIDENFESPVAGTVFADVLSDKKCIVEENTAALRLANPLLAQCKASFFFGITINDARGKPIGILCIVNDKPMKNMHLIEPIVSVFASRAAAELERKNNEDKRKSVEMQLAQAHKMAAIGQLAGGIAHDFNNTISAISGYAHLLRSKLDPASPYQKYIQHIIGAGSRTADLVGQLAQFSHRGTANAQRVNTHELMDETIVFLERTITSSISVEKQFNAKRPVTEGDGTLLQNVLLNLGINARDAMEEKGGEIVFATFDAVLEDGNALCQSFNIEPGNYLLICVSDTGSGMNSDVLSHVFEPFFTTKPKGKGTGLGLANVWGYIENFKGAIEVKSAEGKGATFSLYLPMARSLVPKGCLL